MSVRAMRIDYKQRWRITPLGIALLMAGCGAVIAMAMQYQQSATRLAKLQAVVDHVSRQAKQPPQTTSSTSHMEADVPYMQEVLRRLNLPWDDLFAVLEAAAGKEVALVALRPEPNRGLVRIDGEARDLYSMLEYAQRLQDAKYFGEVSLAEHEITPKGGDKPVRFQLQAKWKL